MWNSDPAPIQPEPIAGQSLLTFCGSTSVTRSKYAKGGREGGEEEEENKLEREKKRCGNSDPAPIQPQPIAGQSLLTACGSTSVARSKYAKGGREGGEEEEK